MKEIIHQIKCGSKDSEKQEQSVIYFYHPSTVEQCFTLFPDFYVSPTVFLFFTICCIILGLFKGM